MLSLDLVSLAAADLSAAQRFYMQALAAVPVPQSPEQVFNLHGVGRFALHASAALNASTGFQGFVLSYIVNQPSEVRAVLDTAVEGGATVRKPAKGSLFGGFAAVFQTPDGAVWKLASERKKDVGPGNAPPQPSETAALLGVADPKASRTFYSALGMTVDRDYGNRYIDFRVTAGGSRLGLMTRDALAKDAGVSAAGTAAHGIVLTHHAASREAVDSLLGQATAAGGTLVTPASDSVDGRYAGQFNDPDGFSWLVIHT